MRGKGYNVYALGAGGTGRHRMVEDLLRRKAESEPTPPDWCYVNNFGDPQQPRRMQLPPGRGLGLAAAMKALIDELRAALPAAFERDEYRARREAIEQQFRQRSEQAFGVLQRQAESKNIALLPTPTGLALAPARSGKVMSLDVFMNCRPPIGNSSNTRSRRSRPNSRQRCARPALGTGAPRCCAGAQSRDHGFRDCSSNG